MLEYKSCTDEALILLAWRLVGQQCVGSIGVLMIHTLKSNVVVPCRAQSRVECYFIRMLLSGHLHSYTLGPGCSLFVLRTFVRQDVTTADFLDPVSLRSILPSEVCCINITILTQDQGGRQLANQRFHRDRVVPSSVMVSFHW